MYRRIIAAAISFTFLPLTAWVAAEEEVTLLVPGLRCENCVKSLTESLSKAGASVGEVFGEAKQVVVSYDSAKLTLHQVVHAVSEAEPVHGERYQAGLVVKLEDFQKSAPKVQSALRRVRGVTQVFPVPNVSGGEIAIVLAPLQRQTRAADFVRTAQIAEALEKSSIKFSGISGSAPAEEPEGTEPKKRQPPTRGTRSKSGDEPGSEKPEAARPAKESAKTKPAGEPAEKDDADPKEAPPRFQILAVAGGRAYLVDHETKSEDGKELKKFVKPGDKFGDYVVKEAADKDGWYVLLEDPETKETVRVELEKKDKEKDGSKGE